MRKVPDNPSALRLPYNDWRPKQKETAEFALNSEKKVTFISQPPGGGKSGIAATVAKMSGRKSVIVTQSKALQQQYVREFKALDLKYIIGRENYSCLIDKSLTVAHGPCQSGWTCPKKLICPYFEKKIQAAKFFSPIITNYSYLLSERSFEQGLFKNLDVLILDEGHLAENALMGFVNVTIDFKEMKSLGIYPQKYGSITQYKQWSLSILNKLSADLYTLAEHIRTSPDPIMEVVFLKRHAQLKKVFKALKDLAYEVQSDWIMEHHPGIVKFRPLWVREYGDMFFTAAKKIIIQSATLASPEKTADLLGLDKENFDVIEVPSQFPRERRPFYYWPVVKLKGRKQSEETLTKLVDAIDRILDEHLNERGIIHTVNSTLKTAILMRSKHNMDMLSHTPETREKVIESFVSGESTGRILVSPSVMAGIDASYHRCSFQIIAKVPFADQSEEQTKRRMAEDPDWYSYQAASHLVQAYGRSMRHADDYGVTYMIDENFGWFYKWNQKLFPRYFTEAVLKVDGPVKSRVKLL